MFVDVLILLFVVFVIISSITVSYAEYKLSKEIQKQMGRYKHE